MKGEFERHLLHPLYIYVGGRIGNLNRCRQVLHRRSPGEGLGRTRWNVARLFALWDGFNAIIIFSGLGYIIWTRCGIPAFTYNICRIVPIIPPFAHRCSDGPQSPTVDHVWKWTKTWKNECNISTRTKDIQKISPVRYTWFYAVLWKLMILVWYSTRYQPERLLRYGIWDDFLQVFEISMG